MKNIKPFLNRLIKLNTNFTIVLGSMLLMTLSFAPAASAACDSRFLGMPPWYMGLTDDADCSIGNIGNDEDSMSNFIWRIVLNVAEAIIILSAYAAVAMIVYGGFMYMIATGQPDKIKSAKNTVMNAIIGLIIALSAVAIVNVIRNII